MNSRGPWNRNNAKDYLKTLLGRKPIPSCTTESVLIKEHSKMFKRFAGRMLDYYYYGRFDTAVRLIASNEDILGNPKAKILDIGCANGDFGTLLLKVLTTKNITGIDSRPTVAPASGLEVITAAVPPLPFPDSYFDLVSCLGTTEHFTEERFAVEEVYRTLRSGGIYLCVMPVETGLAGLFRHIVKNLTYPDRKDCESILDFSLEELLGKCPREKHGVAHKYYNHNFLIQDLYNNFRELSLYSWPRYVPKAVAPELFALCIK